MPSRLQAGSMVTVRDEQWRIERVEPFERCTVVTLDAGNRRRLRVIDPFDRMVPICRRAVAHRNRRTVLRAALQTIASARPPLGLWTAASATMDLLPYQLEPALAVLRGSTRLLLADAVGLGKTVQAGLILSELRERGWVDRALVLCPAGLRETWADELRGRFGISCDVLDQTAIAETVASLPSGINPWTTHRTAIASIDYVKRPEVLAAVCEVPIDLVIADEGHHLTPGTDRGAAIDRLASQSPWCVLVSATPHSGDDAAFDYLTRLGCHHDPIAIFRRSRSDANRTACRRERLIRMRPAGEEMELLRNVEHYAQAIWRSRGADNPFAQLVAITIAKRAASSTLALERTLRRRLLLLNHASEPHQGVLPWNEEDDADDSGAAAVLAVPGLNSQAEEREALNHLLALISRCDRTAKLRWLAAAVARFGEPAIIFTEYRDTLEAVLAVLSERLRAAAICGTTPIDERRRAVDAFNRGGVEVLVATDTAGEGLNLHHRCRLIIDVELPWNPLRLEQRIGRIDRLGQRHRVHALRLFYPDTVEERVLERLELRRRRADWLNDGATIDERAVAAAVLGNHISLPKRITALTTATVGAAAMEHARLRCQRASASLGISASESVSAAPKHRVATSMVAVHAVSYFNDAGTMVGELPVAHKLETSRPTAAERRCAWIDALGASNRLQASVQEHVERTCNAIEQELTPLRTAVSDRIASIQSQIAADRTREVQRSLFDRRADAAAAHVNERATVLDAALRRRQLTVAARVRPDAARERLAAMWPAMER